MAQIVITKAPLSPKDYPFYYPDEHKNIITLLEQKQPAAIIAVTGPTTLNGKDPFPLFEDGNFLIPSASINRIMYKTIEDLLNAGINTAGLEIMAQPDQENNALNGVLLANGYIYDKQKKYYYKKLN